MSLSQMQSLIPAPDIRKGYEVTYKLQLAMNTYEGYAYGVR